MSLTLMNPMIRKGLTPSSADVHVNRPLTAISTAYIQTSAAFVADRVMSVVPVAKQSDLYFRYDKGSFKRSNMRKRAPGTESAGADYEVDTKPYHADVWALHKNVADETRANEDVPLSSDRDATIWLSQQSLIFKEKLFVETYLTNNDPGETWTFAAKGAADRSAALDFTDANNNSLVFWNDDAATPIEDIRLMKRTILENTGYMPNILTMSRQVYDILIDHTDIINRLNRGQTNGPAQANKMDLAALFEVDEILVMDGVQNTADEGAADAFSFIGGKHVLLTYRPPAPGLQVPSAGYTFAWTGLIGASAVNNMAAGTRISRFREDLKKSDRIEIETAFTYEVVGADLGMIVANIVQ